MVGSLSRANDSCLRSFTNRRRRPSSKYETTRFDRQLAGPCSSYMQLADCLGGTKIGAGCKPKTLPLIGGRGVVFLLDILSHRTTQLDKEQRRRLCWTRSDHAAFCPP